MHAYLPQISGPKNTPRSRDSKVELCPTISTIPSNGGAYQSRSKRRTNARMQVQSMLRLAARLLNIITDEFLWKRLADETVVSAYTMLRVA
jgi:hypothetical protein